MNKKIPKEQEIAKKHNISIDYVIKQAEIGSTVEREHVTTHDEAYGIALQHIMEFPDYYSHLLSMEKDLKKEWKKSKLQKLNKTKNSLNKSISNSNMKNKINNTKKINEEFDKFYKEHCGCEEALDKKDGISKKCINTPSGTYCPVHGKKSCPKIDSEKNKNEENLNILSLIEKISNKNYSKFFIDSENLTICISEDAAWTKKEGKNKNGGLNEKGRKSYERENPGSDLKAPSKKIGNPRRASFCARMKGLKKKLTSKKTAKDPNSRVNKSLRAWVC